MKSKQASIKSGYNVPYWWYDIRGFFIFKLSYQDSLFSTVRFFSSNYSKKHLEVAVGSGSFMDLCLKWRSLRRKEKPAGIAFDYTSDMLLGAENQFKDNNSWQTELADVTNMRYEEASFDTINVANAFHCFADPKKSAHELNRVLSLGGTLAVNVLTPARGLYPLKRIAERIAKWGQRTKILEAPIEKSAVHRIFTDAGFEVINERWSGNNLSLQLRKVKLESATSAQ